jgi:hypothetical protein
LSTPKSSLPKKLEKRPIHKRFRRYDPSKRPLDSLKTPFNHGAIREG